MAGCGAAAGMAAFEGSRPAAGAPGGEFRVLSGPRAQLLLEGKTPLQASQVVPHRSYVFLYPFESTPCFLLNLGRPVPGTQVGAEGGSAGYAWPGGVGRDRSIVAYSAICPHTYAHPTREAAMIHYYGPDTPATVAQRAGVITCCLHGSTFDPGRGAVPLQPPAEAPLAAVLTEWDELTDALYVRGVVGRPAFDEFFKSFPKNVRREVQEVTPVWELERYSRAVLSC